MQVSSGTKNNSFLIEPSYTTVKVLFNGVLLVVTGTWSSPYQSPARIRLQTKRGLAGKHHTRPLLWFPQCMLSTPNNRRRQCKDDHVYYTTCFDRDRSSDAVANSWFVCKQDAISYKISSKIKVDRLKFTLEVVVALEASPTTNKSIFTDDEDNSVFNSTHKKIEVFNPPAIYVIPFILAIPGNFWHATAANPPWYDVARVPQDGYPLYRAYLERTREGNCNSQTHSEIHRNPEDSY
ncbi:uncharacterized protein TNCV_668271 [Trichonephila clavipes]|nr:uncharacterized protein TNCV_668271 [Trichonephila clavipes]